MFYTVTVVPAQHTAFLSARPPSYALASLRLCTDRLSSFSTTTHNSINTLVSSVSRRGAGARYDGAGFGAKSLCQQVCTRAFFHTDSAGTPRAPNVSFGECLSKSLHSGKRPEVCRRSKDVS